MITDKRLREIRSELTSAAHGLPWRRGIGNDTGIIYDSHDHMITTDCAGSACTFLSDAPRIVQELLDEVWRLRVELEPDTAAKETP